MTKNIRLATDPGFLQGYIKRRLPAWYPRTPQLDALDIHINRNFLNLYVSLALTYKLKLHGQHSHRQMIWHGQARHPKKEQRAAPERSFRILKHLERRGWHEHICHPIDYCRPANLLLYEHTPGRDTHSWLEEASAAQLTVRLKQAAKRVALLLKRLHRLTPPSGFQRTSAVSEAKIVHKQLGLLRRYYPAGARAAASAWQSCQKDQPILFHQMFLPTNQRLVHGDAHLGNILLSRGQLIVIDFDDGGWGIPENDIARFFVQTERFLNDHRVPVRAQMKSMQDIFLRHYYQRKTLTTLQCFAYHYYAVRHLIQIMTITSFTTKGTVRVAALHYLLGRLERSRSALVNLEAKLAL